MEEQISLNELEFVLLIFMGVFLLLCISIIFFIVLYSKKQRQNQVEKELLQKSFESEKLTAQLEISEQTMQELSQELHDNIGQRISLVIQGFRKEFGEKHELSIVLHETLNDLRQMSKNMNGSYLEKVGIDLAIERECKRINSVININCNYKPTEDYLELNPGQEIILFRCFQELINNVIKHSKATQCSVLLQRSGNQVVLCVEDNGVGLKEEHSEPGVGRISLENRVKLLKGNIHFDSNFDTGTKVTVSIPIHTYLSHD